MARTYQVYLPVKKDLTRSLRSLEKSDFPVEDNLHMFAAPCNILYILSYTKPYHIVPFFTYTTTKPYGTIRYHTMPYKPYHTPSFHIIPYRTVTHHATPNHVTSCSSTIFAAAQYLVRFDHVVSVVGQTSANTPGQISLAQLRFLLGK